MHLKRLHVAQRTLLCAQCIRLLREPCSVGRSLAIIILYYLYRWRRYKPWGENLERIIKYDVREWASTCLLNPSSNPKCSSSAPPDQTMSLLQHRGPVRPVLQLLLLSVPQHSGSLQPGRQWCLWVAAVDAMRGSMQTSVKWLFMHFADVWRW